MRKNEKRKTKNEKFSGFTLIEVITVSGIMALFSITLISVFMASFRGGTKSQLLQRIRQDGDYVLTSMSREIKKAKTIDNIANCVAGAADLQLTLVDGSSITYSLSSDKIASDSSFLTGTAGKAENLNFRCYVVRPGKQIVTISFTLSAGEETGSQAQEKLTQNFATSVSTREH